jgi:DNA-binding NarL/FixJ family response regulator
MNAASPTVIIADDHPLFRVALRLSLLGLAPRAEILEVDSFDLLKSAIAANPAVDLVLLDLLMPGSEGLSSLESLHKSFPAVRLAVVSTLPQRTWVRSVQALGAAAFIHKSVTPEKLTEALRKLFAGGSWWPQSAPAESDRDDFVERGLERLSKQEMRILLYIKEGRINKQIAEDLRISESTVKAHVSAILHKLGLSSRTQAAVLVQRMLSASGI